MFDVILETRKILALTNAREEPIYQQIFHGISEEEIQRINLYIGFIANQKFPVQNTSISKQLKEHGNLYEIKPKPYRVFFFMVGNDAVLIHGFLKRKQKTDKHEISRAVALRNEYIRG